MSSAPACNGKNNPSAADKNSNAVAPFRERLQPAPADNNSDAPLTKPHAACPRQQQQQQPHSPKPFQPIAAVRAVAKVAAAEAAVTAAAAALVPSKPAAQHARTQHASSSSGGAHKLQQQQQQPAQAPSAATQPADEAAAGLRVQGLHTGPRRSSISMAGTQRRSSQAAEIAAASGGLTEAAAQHGGACSASGMQQLHVAAMLQTLSVSCAAAGQQHQQQPSAAAQLAARGLTKRIRAQLRSAHGPPPYQRSLPPPRPASPPPVMLDGDLLMAYSPDAPSPAHVAMADLSSCSISAIAAPPSASTAAEAAGQAAGAAAGDTQLHCFSQLVSLDLSDNRLQCFAGLAVLPSLQQLNLSANRFKCLRGLQERLAEAQHTSMHTSSKQGALQEPPSEQCALQEQQQQQEEEVVAVEEEEHPSSVVVQARERQWEQEQQEPLISPSAVCFGFNSLCVLDVSYNSLSGEQLLGQASPLGWLPMLSELHAGGNGISTLGAQLAPFTSLSLLNLAHNQLQMTAVATLGQLPALQLLDLSHNPLNGSAQCAEQPVEAPHCFPALQLLDLSNSSVKQPQPLQELLARMQRLEVLQLAHTPLAERCKAGKVDAQVQQLVMQRPGLAVWLSDSTSTTRGSTSGSKGSPRSKHPASAADAPSLRVPVLKIPEAASSSKVLAAASRATLACLPHEQLVAAFDRVAAGIDSWQQLAPVPEEEGSWDQQQQGGDSEQQQQQPAADGEPVPEDKTFLTSVGITGELPGGEEGSAGPDAASSQGFSSDQQAEAWQDPTERLAVALGLQVSQLAHMTGRQPGNPDGALHRLRHALTHPLVDPDAGQRPQQHHMRTTAAAAAKGSGQGRLLPLAQPIASTLSTRVQPVEDLAGLLKGMRGRLMAMQGTMLPQLQAQATKMTGTSGQTAAAAAAGRQ